MLEVQLIVPPLFEEDPVQKRRIVGFVHDLQAQNPDSKRFQAVLDQTGRLSFEPITDDQIERLKALAKNLGSSFFSGVAEKLISGVRVPPLVSQLLPNKSA